MSKTTTKEFKVLAINGQAVEAKGYSDAMQKAVNVLDHADVAVVVIRIEKAKVSA